MNRSDQITQIIKALGSKHNDGIRDFAIHPEYYLVGGAVVHTSIKHTGDPYHDPDSKTSTVHVKMRLEIDGEQLAVYEASRLNTYNETDAGQRLNEHMALHHGVDALIEQLKA